MIIKCDKRHLAELASVDFESEHPKGPNKGQSISRFGTFQKKKHGTHLRLKINLLVTLKGDFPGYKHCEIYWLAVRKSFQGKRIGSALVSYIIKIAKDKGYRKVCLYTDEGSPKILQEK